MRLPGRLAAAAAPIALLALAATSSNCIHTLQAGEIGNVRFVGVVRNTVPLKVLPPTSDRAGNLYTMYGAPDLTANPDGTGGTLVFVSAVTGGERSVCEFSHGDTGAHGFVGFTRLNAYYWSGYSLVAVAGSGGNCNPIIDKDPSSGNVLEYRAVVPHVLDSAAGHPRTVAFIQTPSDRLPFQAVIDLDNEVYINSQAVQPNDAEQLVVLGTGYDTENDVGTILMQYRRGNAVTIDARFLDDDANTVARVTATDEIEYPAFAGQGFVQSTKKGGFAALLVRPSSTMGDDEVRKVLFYDRGGARFVAIPGGMNAVGIHSWEGNLWLVGTKSERPVVAAFDDSGNIGDPRVWQASEQLAQAIAHPLNVVDDRSLPSHVTVWDSPTNATGGFPFVNPYSPNHYADNTTLWLIAGPSFASGGMMQTAVGVVPVGITYP